MIVEMCSTFDAMVEFIVCFYSLFTVPSNDNGNRDSVIILKLMRCTSTRKRDMLLVFY